MNATGAIHDALIARKITDWYNRAMNPRADMKEIRYARANYWKLVRRYPKIAARCGYTEVMVLNPTKSRARAS
jgi:hypothetical protein